MPAHRGQAWGNALGGYKYQRRAKGGQFSKGKVQSFSKAMAKGKDNKAGITKWQAAGIGVGAALLTGAVVGGGVYAYKSGLHKKLLKAPTISMKSADASVKVSAKIAAGSAAKNIGKAAVGGTAFRTAKKDLENLSALTINGGKAAASLVNGTGGDNIFEKIQQGAKATASLSGAVVAASGATAVVKATASGLIDSSRDKNLQDAPKKRRTPRMPKPAVIPQPGSKNVAAQGSSKKISNEVSKGAPHEAGQSNVEPSAVSDVFGKKIGDISIDIDGRSSRKSIIATKRPKDYTQRKLSPEELALYKATKKKSLSVKSTPNRRNENVTKSEPTPQYVTQQSNQITAAIKAQQGAKVAKRAYTDKNGIYHPSGFGSVDDD